MMVGQAVMNVVMAANAQAKGVDSTAAAHITAQAANMGLAPPEDVNGHRAAGTPAWTSTPANCWIRRRRWAPRPRRNARSASGFRAETRRSGQTGRRWRPRWLRS